jgi:hypothetical protein
MSYNNNQAVVRIVEAETFNERLERLYSYFDKLPTFIEKGKYTNKDPSNNIQAIVTKPEGSHFVKEWHYGHNVVTDAGDIYYAQQGANQTPTNDFAGANNRIELRTSADTPTKADTYSGILGVQTTTRKALFTGYPTANDPDGDNTAANKTRTTTYSYQWGTADFNLTGLVGGGIHALGGSPIAGTPLLTHFTIATFDKTSSDTLKMFVNHAFLGA